MALSFSGKGSTNSSSLSLPASWPKAFLKTDLKKNQIKNSLWFNFQVTAQELTDTNIMYISTDDPSVKLDIFLTPEL